MNEAPINVLKEVSFDLPPFASLWVDNSEGSSIAIDHVYAGLNGEKKVNVLLCTLSAHPKYSYIKGYCGTLLNLEKTTFYLVYKGAGEYYPINLDELKSYNIIDVYHPFPQSIMLVGRRKRI